MNGVLEKWSGGVMGGERRVPSAERRVRNAGLGAGKLRFKMNGRERTQKTQSGAKKNRKRKMKNWGRWTRIRNATEANQANKEDANPETGPSGRVARINAN